MATDIDIASNALLLVGDSPISSFTEDGAGATAAANLYPNTYAQVLSEHAWTFATKEQQLNRLSQAPDALTGYKYAFQLPTDLIMLWAIFPNNTNYKIVNGLLYSNNKEHLARYCYKPDETSLPPHFIKALEYKLAADFAISITENTTRAEFYEAKYLKYIAQARTIDSQQAPSTVIQDSPFVAVRFGGSDSSGYR